MPWWVWIGLIFLVYKLLDRLVRIPITSSPNGEKDRILITGCDSGFGNLFSKRLASKGFHVYAGCLTATGKHKLEEETPSCLKALLLDVTQPDSIRAAYDEIARFLPPGKGLWAVINNAGTVADQGEVSGPSPQIFFVSTSIKIARIPLFDTQIY